MKNAVRFAIGVIGNVTSLLLFLSPVPTIRRIHEKKEVEGFHPFPYLAAVLNCAFWVFYGLPFNHPDSILVVTINSVGLLLELIYISIFVFYAGNKMRAKTGGAFAAEVVVFSCIALGDLLGFHTHAKRSLFVGIVCVIFGVILYASPLSVTAKMVKTKSSEFMPVWVCAAGLVNGLVWTVYACIGKLDPFILASNGIGGVLGLVQLIVWFWYRPKGGFPAAKSSEIELPV